MPEKTLQRYYTRGLNECFKSNYKDNREDCLDNDNNLIKVYILGIYINLTAGLLEKIQYNVKLAFFIIKVAMIIFPVQQYKNVPNKKSLKTKIKSQ